MLLDDLTADELAMLAHALRMVPGNACLTGRSAALLHPEGGGVAFFVDVPAYKSLWEKVGDAIVERDDMARHRKPEVAL
jgi:hypothetical protein